jgi:hopene-associated glycosyltransferase HpnB
MNPLLLLGALCCAIWLYLLLLNGGFWMANQRDDADTPADPETWPTVAAVVPARDEADVIARSVGSLLDQDYPGAFHVVLVDDGSSDGTAEAARAEAARLGRADRLTVLTGMDLPPGWTGKLWAMSQGHAYAAKTFAPELILFTDADIGHAPENLRSLVARAQAGGLALTSQMVRLHCETWPERLLIPAFVFFFQMLYPFGRVNRPSSPTAAAAGGCMLVRRKALEAAGGVGAIRTALIDDCTLGALMKKQGPIWLGLTERAHSLRPYRSFAQAGRMISRSAYAQLKYSPLLLAGTLLGLFVTYLAPVALVVFARGEPQALGAVAWGVMAATFQPMLRFYRRSPLWGLALPLIGAIYGALTFQSAWDTWRGKGGMWKGRAQAQAEKADAQVRADGAAA